MEYYKSKDSKTIPDEVYAVFQRDLSKYYPSIGGYPEGAVWNLAMYKEDRVMSFKDLIHEYARDLQQIGPETEVVKLFHALRFSRKESIEDLAKELLETERRRVEVFYPVEKRKPVTVRINVDLYYEINTAYLPAWLQGDGLVKAIAEAFEDAGPTTFASLSSVLKQAPNEVAINNFNYDH